MNKIQRWPLGLQRLGRTSSYKFAQIQGQKDGRPQSATPPPETGNSLSRCIIVCLRVLLFLLLLVVTGLCVTYGIQKGKLQTEKDQLLTSHLNLTEKRNQLLIKMNEQQTEMDQLRNYNSNLTTEKKDLNETIDQLRARIHHLESPCETGWKYFDYRCYLYVKLARTWSESRKFCQNKEADLVVINTNEKQIFLSNWTSGGWIGLSKKEETWNWVDNTELCKGYWQHGQPNGSRENCVAFLKNNKNPTATWHDYTCDTGHYFTCEKNIQHY